ncbi:MAG: phosphoribosyltransferase [Acidobacteriota bacterium]
MAAGWDDVPARTGGGTLSDGSEKLFVDARTLLLNSLRLAQQVWDDGYRPNYLIGIWRGGTPPAIAIHEFFRLRGEDPYHTTIKTQSYRGMQRGEAGVEIKGLEHVIDVIEAGDRMLLVDDVFDTGHTMVAILDQIHRRARRNTPECRVAAVYYKPARNESDLVPHYYTVADNRWIVFPHELEGLTDEELREHKPSVHEILFTEHRESVPE